MKVFITGIAGFLGSHLADLMIANGHEVAGNDNMIGGYEDNVPQGAQFHQIDCRDLDKLTAAMQGSDIVYHCAATAYEGLSVFSPVLVTQNIFEASVSAVTAAIKNNVKRFVYCSSMARYGTNQTPFRETYQPLPQDPYGIAKEAGERVVKNLCETHGVEWNVAVPHNIVGPRQKYDDPFRNVMSIMLNRMLQGKAPIIYGDGKQMRCFSYIDDCLYCLNELAFNEKVVGEIINIGPDEEFVTINYLAELCANETGCNLAPIHYEDRPKEVKLATCSAEKARILLGYKTTTSLKTAVKKTADYIRLRGTRKFKYHLPLEIINDRTPKTWKDKLI
jgi:UDP-glucose 4-epimerase